MALEDVAREELATTVLLEFEAEAAEEDPTVLLGFESEAEEDPAVLLDVVGPEVDPVMTMIELELSTTEKDTAVEVVSDPLDETPSTELG